MFCAGRSLYDLSSICDNSLDKLSSYSEEGFSTFSFSDLILPLTPSCLNENLIEMPLKSPSPLIEMFPTDTMSKDQLPDVSEGEDFSALSPFLAQLSPGIEDKKLFVGDDWLLDFPQASTEDFHLSGLTAEDFDELKSSPAGNLDSSEEAKFELLLELVGGGSREQEVADSVTDCYPDTVDWLTRTTIAPEHLDLNAASECVETVVREEKKQVLQEILIPSTVPDTFLCDAEVTSSKSAERKVVKSSQQPSSSTKGRKRLRVNLEPGTEEYKKKRELNNISVRKSREKARQKQQETEERADLLVAENDRLQARVDSLEKELMILRGLFTNIGATLPIEINTLLPAE